MKRIMLLVVLAFAAATAYVSAQQKNDKEVKEASLFQIGKRRKELSEEIGDMYISLMAIMNHYGVTCEEVNEYVDKKLNKKY